jgi:hypothetical protein
VNAHKQVSASLKDWIDEKDVVALVVEEKKRK